MLFIFIKLILLVMSNSILNKMNDIELIKFMKVKSKNDNYPQCPNSPYIFLKTPPKKH
jgi:hypothetical protein